MARQVYLRSVWIPGKEGWGDVCGGYVWEFVISWIHFATPQVHNDLRTFLLHPANMADLSHQDNNERGTA